MQLDKRTLRNIGISILAGLVGGGFFTWIYFSGISRIESPESEMNKPVYVPEEIGTASGNQAAVEKTNTEPGKQAVIKEPAKEPVKVPVKPIVNLASVITSWKVQAIDTMKYSRDLSREKMNDKSFDAIIDSQIKNIAEIGATHVVIATPYDAEFLPMLKRWVSAARKYNLKVWFRGNWSGWEKWFGYPSITRDEHMKKTKDFILANADIFKDADIFSSCPECENGGPGDPRSNGDLNGHRAFIISEYQAEKSAFAKIGKNVKANYFSMNGDVARLVMDKETTKALDGIVTIDHYVKTSERLVNDIKSLAAESGGRVVLGEFGAPIPDIHGEMTEAEQARWVNENLSALVGISSLEGVNYWVNVGGSTELWDGNGKARAAVSEIRKFYKPAKL
jgi:hypothetical protein